MPFEEDVDLKWMSTISKCDKKAPLTGSSSLASLGPDTCKVDVFYDSLCRSDSHL